MLVDLYIDHTERSAVTRRHRQSLLQYTKSPLQSLPGIAELNGREPRRIPRDRFIATFGDVNPLLIEQMQEVWVRQNTSVRVRLAIFNALKLHLQDPARRDHLTEVPLGLEGYASFRHPHHWINFASKPGQRSLYRDL